MGRLATLLEAEEPLFDIALEQLAKDSGKTDADAKLVAELAEKTALITREVGLELDATGPELYEALLKKVKDQDAQLAKRLGSDDPENVVDIIPLVLRRLEQVHMERSCFALKDEKAASILQQRPPKELMKRLGYDDVATMTAKEDLAELFIAIRFTEGSEWLNEFNTVYAELKASDFEERPIRLVVFNPAKWGDVAAHFIEKKKHINTHSKEMGVVAILPPPQPRMKAITLKVLTLTLHYFNEVRLYSAYFRLLKDKNNFGEIFSQTLIADTPHIPLHKRHIHWRVIQRYYGKIGEGAQHPEIFQPHLQPEDLHWRSAEQTLYQIDPDMGLWRDMDYAATVKGDDIVTFNLMDVALSYANEIPYEDRYLYHFRESLWNEVFARYMGEETLNEQLLVKLDNAVVDPAALPIE